MKKSFRVLNYLLASICFSSYVSALEITAVGDISITQKIIDTRGDDLREIKLAGDIVFANFEGVLSERHTREDTLKLKLTMPSAAVDILKKIGINTLSLANNHSLDLGSEFYSKTLSDLNGNGFIVVGLDDNGKVINSKGMKVRFIAFSFTGANNVNDLAKVANLIRSFKEDIIVVSAHMGGEGSKAYLIPHKMEFFEDEKRGDVVKFAHACIDAGAHLVIGHGPHILRGVELYRNKLIVYSLGNFIFDYPGVEKHGSTPAYSITVSTKPNGDFQQARITSYTLKYGVPVLDKGSKAYRLIKVLSLTNLKSDSLIFTEDGTIYPKGGKT